MMSLGRNVSNFYRNDKQYVLYSHRTDRLGQLVKWYHTVIDIPRLLQYQFLHYFSSGWFGRNFKQLLHITFFVSTYTFSGRFGRNPHALEITLSLT